MKLKNFTMITEDKVTEIFCFADDFCKVFDARFLSFWDSTKVLFCVSFYIQMLTEILMHVSSTNLNQQEQETAFLTAFAIPVLQ